MDIQEIQEKFEDLLLANPDFDESLLGKDEEGCYSDSDIQHMYSMFEVGTEVGEQWQVKAQAVPEGFVLVKKVHPDAIVHNQGLGLFKECQVIYGWAGKSKDFKDALNKGFYHGVKLGAKAVLETAMIKAQEPANDTN